MRGAECLHPVAQAGQAATGGEVGTADAVVTDPHSHQTVAGFFLARASQTYAGDMATAAAFE